jgi:predicted dehydrogenase
MNLLIIGAGRMGIRHAVGALKSDTVNSLTIVDKSENALNLARSNIQSLKTKKIVNYGSDWDYKLKYDIIILATTADDRVQLVKSLVKYSPRFILLEKPLAQSLDEVENICDILSRVDTKLVCINLNNRLLSAVQKLSNDLSSLNQFQGKKHLNVTAGAIGIGNNGIHYIDTAFYILNADKAVLQAAEIYDQMIPSGRGPQYGDFGGWAKIDFTRNGESVGQMTINIIPTSSYGGELEVIGSHGCIRLDLIRGRYTRLLRRADSQLPVYRYSSEYDNLEEYLSPLEPLEKLTENWLNGLNSGLNSLPDLNYGLMVHRILFQWLSHGANKINKYPIT